MAQVNGTAQQDLSEHTKITVGKEDIMVPPLTFARLEKAWEPLDEWGTLPVPSRDMKTLDANRLHSRRMRLVLSIFAIALERVRPDLTADALAEKLRFEEQWNLIPKLNELLTKSGLQREETAGPLAEEAETPVSTGTISAH